LTKIKTPSNAKFLFFNSFAGVQPAKVKRVIDFLKKNYSRCKIIIVMENHNVSLAMNKSYREGSFVVSRVSKAYKDYFYDVSDLEEYGFHVTTGRDFVRSRALEQVEYTLMSTCDQTVFNYQIICQFINRAKILDKVYKIEYDKDLQSLGFPAVDGQIQSFIESEYFFHKYKLNGFIVRKEGDRVVTREKEIAGYMIKCDPLFEGYFEITYKGFKYLWGDFYDDMVIMSRNHLFDLGFDLNEVFYSSTNIILEGCDGIIVPSFRKVEQYIKPFYCFDIRSTKICVLEHLMKTNFKLNVIIDNKGDGEYMFSFRTCKFYFIRRRTKRRYDNPSSIIKHLKFYKDNQDLLCKKFGIREKRYVFEVRESLRLAMNYLKGLDFEIRNSLS
jgi:hypothetical protein